MIKKLLALPQVWLFLSLLAELGIGMLLPVPLPPLVRVAGFLLFGAGAALMLWAAGTMQMAQTTFLPGRRPDHLVTNGPFAYSRNPIYFGDLIVLASLMLALDKAAGLVMVPVLLVVLDRLFIRKEEAVIENHFGPAFAAYRNRVRRWL